MCYKELRTRSYAPSPVGTRTECTILLPSGTFWIKAQHSPCVHLSLQVCSLNVTHISHGCQKTWTNGDGNLLLNKDAVIHFRSRCKEKKQLSSRPVWTRDQLYHPQSSNEVHGTWTWSCLMVMFLILILHLFCILFKMLFYTASNLFCIFYYFFK